MVKKCIFLYFLFCAHSVLAAERLSVLEWRVFTDPVYHQLFSKKYEPPIFIEQKNDEDTLKHMLDGEIDMAHICGHSISVFTQQNAIAPFINNRIPNFHVIFVPFMRQRSFFVNNLAMMVPTDWGYVANIINPERVAENERYTLRIYMDRKNYGRFALSESWVDSYFLAFAILGVRGENQINNMENIKAASDILTKIHQNGAKYWKVPSDAANLLTRNEVDFLWGYNEVTTKTRDAGLYVMPIFDAREGFATYACGYVQSANSARILEVSHYVNNLLDRSISENMVNGLGYWHTNQAKMLELQMKDDDQQDFVNLIQNQEKSIWQIPIKPEYAKYMAEQYKNIRASKQ